jgi:hypothetical protein
LYTIGQLLYKPALLWAIAMLGVLANAEIIARSMLKPGESVRLFPMA